METQPQSIIQQFLAVQFALILKLSDSLLAAPTHQSVLGEAGRPHTALMPLLSQYTHGGVIAREWVTMQQAFMMAQFQLTGLGKVQQHHRCPANLGAKTDRANGKVNKERNRWSLCFYWSKPLVQWNRYSLYWDWPGVCRISVGITFYPRTFSQSHQELKLGQSPCPACALPPDHVPPPSSVVQSWKPILTQLCQSVLLGCPPAHCCGALGGKYL